MKTSPLSVLIPAQHRPGRCRTAGPVDHGRSVQYVELRAPGLDGTPTRRGRPRGAARWRRPGRSGGWVSRRRCPAAGPGFAAPAGTRSATTARGCCAPARRRARRSCGRSRWARATPRRRSGTAVCTCWTTTKRPRPTRCAACRWPTAARSGGTAIRSSVAPNHGMSRTIPAVAGDAVVSIGPRCHVACWDAATGQCRWLIDMVRQFGTEERQWYTGQCPLIDGDRVILAPCGPDSLLAAVDLKTGDVLWKTPNPRGWKMTHSSIMPMEFAGRRMYVYCGTGGTAGVAADDGRTAVRRDAGRRISPPAPRPCRCPAGGSSCPAATTTIGAMMLQLEEADGKLTAKTAFTLDATSSSTPSSRRRSSTRTTCTACAKQAAASWCAWTWTARNVWNSGQLKFGHGPYLIADGLILALSGRRAAGGRRGDAGGVSAGGQAPGDRATAARPGARWPWSAAGWCSAT